MRADKTEWDHDMETRRAAPNHETVGELFRKLRMERSLEITDIAQETRIPPETLRAMEADDYSMLPAKAFARGFYGLYAKLLGLNQEEVVQRFSEEYAQDSHGRNKEDASSQSWGEDNISSIAERPSHTVGSIISFSLVVIILVGAGISWYAGYNPAKQISNWLRGFQETVEVVNEPATQANQQVSPAEQSTQQALPQLPEPVEKPATQETKYRLVAEFQQPANITIRLDDAAPEQLSLPAGSIESWQADQHIVLELPIDAPVRLYLNGIIVPLPPAVDGKIIVSIPEYFRE